MKRAVFIDRDGVLNEAVVREGLPYPPASAADANVCVDAHDACHALVDDGWLLFVVTNQPDIARARCTRDEVDAINAVVTEGLPIAEVLVCPHDDADECACRKPKPGMLLDAARRWDIDLSASVTVGDRWRDIEAGKRAGTRTIFVQRGYSEPLRTTPDHIVANLREAAELLRKR